MVLLSDWFQSDAEVLTSSEQLGPAKEEKLGEFVLT